MTNCGRGALAVFTLCLMLSGCEERGTEGAEVASDCVEADLIAQCPVGTVPRLEANAETICDQEGSLNVSGNMSDFAGDGEIRQVCSGSGQCQVVCELQSPCSYGVERLSREEIVCAPAPPGDLCERGRSRCESRRHPLPRPKASRARRRAGAQRRGVRYGRVDTTEDGQDGDEEAS